MKLNNIQCVCAWGEPGLMAGLASGKGVIAILKINAAADFDACRAVRRRKASDISVQVQASACMHALCGIGRRGCDSGGSTPSLPDPRI